MALDADLLEHDGFKIRIACERLIEGCRTNRIRIDFGRVQHGALAHNIVCRGDPTLQNK